MRSVKLDENATQGLAARRAVINVTPVPRRYIAYARAKIGRNKTIVSAPGSARKATMAARGIQSVAMVPTAQLGRVGRLMENGVGVKREMYPYMATIHAVSADTIAQR
jgi:hypothetical protein